jgi:hypothetical protein
MKGVTIMIKIGDIVYIGNSKTFGLVLDIVIIGNKTKVRVNKGYGISSYNLRALHLTTDKTEADLPKTFIEAKENKVIARQGNKIFPEPLTSGKINVILN